MLEYPEVDVAIIIRIKRVAKKVVFGKVTFDFKYFRSNYKNREVESREVEKVTFDFKHFRTIYKKREVESRVREVVGKVTFDFKPFRTRYKNLEVESTIIGKSKYDFQIFYISKYSIRHLKHKFPFVQMSLPYYPH